MSSLFELTIPHPEPARDNYRLIPVFLPFAGCPGRCIFCDQQAQTGSTEARLSRIYAELGARVAIESAPFGLGFYGGTFTGMDRMWQLRFLELAATERARGRLVHVRASTRPDSVTPEWLGTLHSAGLNMLELGVQSFDSDVLARSRRGYDREVAITACRMVQNSGLVLGIQLLPGLPGHGVTQWSDDVSTTLSLMPHVVRMYPCVVMENTELARMHTRGEYAPWSLAQTVEELATALLQFWKQDIRIIRMGVPGDAQEHILAGPWHSAFGNMVRSSALLKLLTSSLAPHCGKIRRIVLPVRLGGEIWGVKRANLSALNSLGITKQIMSFADRPDILVEVEI